MFYSPIKRIIMDLQSIRQEKHQVFLKQKYAEEQHQLFLQKLLNEELEQIDDIINNLKNNIDDIKKFDVIRILLVVSTFLRHIDSNIFLIKKHNKLADLIPIFFNLVNKIIEIRETYSGYITINEIKFLNDIKNNLYKIMDLIEIDRCLVKIELMDTSNDINYARQLHKKINGF